MEDFERRETFSDHNAILLNIDLPLKGGVQTSVRETTWNFNDQSGWEKFTSLTERDSVLTACWKDSSSVEVSYRSWEKRLDSLKNKSSKKRRVRTQKLMYTREIRSLIGKKKSLKRLLIMYQVLIMI